MGVVDLYQVVGGGKGGGYSSWIFYLCLCLVFSPVFHLFFQVTTAK